MVPADYGTPQRLITMALRDAGKIARTAVPDSAWMLDGMQRLADILYYQQTQGLKLWLLEDLTMPLVAGTATYTIGPGGDIDMPKPFRIEFGYATDSQGNRRQIDPIAYHDYVHLSNTTQEGQVTQYFVDKQKDLLHISLWLVPDATQVLGSVHLIARRKAAHLENLTEDMTFPPEWYLALRWALAAEFATGAPISVQNRCQVFADKYLEALEGFDIEDVSTFIRPDLQQAAPSGFR